MMYVRDIRTNTRHFLGKAVMVKTYDIECDCGLHRQLTIRLDRLDETNRIHCHCGATERLGRLPREKASLPPSGRSR